MLKGIEWIYFLLCVVFCVYAFIDKEFVFGIVFTILTIVGTVGSVKSNIRNKKK